MGTCSNCGDTGSNPFTCPALTSDVTWDGGATCTGFSSGDLNDILQHLASEICQIQTDFSAFTAASDDITLSTLVGSCFTTTTGGTLTDWIDEAEDKICTLITDLAALDLTEPMDFNDTPVAAVSQVAYQTLDTITVAANTLDANNEYLVVEFFVTADTTATANCKCKITFAGADAVIWDLMASATLPNDKTGLAARVVLTRKTSNTLCVDWTGTYLCNKNIPQCSYGVASNLTPLDFTVSNDITIQGLKDTGTITMVRSRTTKYSIA